MIFIFGSDFWGALRVWPETPIGLAGELIFYRFYCTRTGPLENESF